MADDNINSSLNPSSNPASGQTPTPPSAVPVGGESSPAPAPSGAPVPSEPTSFGAPSQTPAPTTPPEENYVSNLMESSAPAGDVTPATGESYPQPTEPAAPPVDSSMPAGTEPVPDYGAPTEPTMPTPNNSSIMPPSQPDADPSQSWTGEAVEPPKKSNIWLPVVVLLIIVVAAAIYFIYANSSSTDTTSTTTQSTTTTGGETEVTTGTTTTVSNDTTRKEDLTKIQEALEKYYRANQKYPISTEIIKTSDKNSTLASLVPDYIDKLPTDPAGGESYYGYKSADGTTYELSAVFDEAPASVKSTQIAKGYLVTLTPGIVFEQ